MLVGLQSRVSCGCISGDGYAALAAVAVVACDGYWLPNTNPKFIFHVAKYGAIFSFLLTFHILA